jgi:hypothetical protein
MDIFGCEDFERDVAGRSAFDFMPEIQPDGRRTEDMANEFLMADNASMDFACFKLNGEPFTARITSCNIVYMGKPSSFAIIEDITERKLVEIKKEEHRAQLEQMVEIKTLEIREHQGYLENIRRRQDILIKVLQIVQYAENLDDALNGMISEIGKFMDVSRVYVYEKNYDGLTYSNICEWCNEGIEPFIDKHQNVPVEKIQMFFHLPLASILSISFGESKL